MEDKVKRIRAEIEKVKLIIQSNKAQGAFSEGYIIGQESVLEHFEKFFDSMKEEPKEWLQELQERLNSLSKEDFKKVWAKYKLREEGHVDYNKLNTMLEKSLSKETKESWNERLGEEPVSEDLEKAAEQDVCEAVNTCSAIGIPNDHIPSWVQDAIIHGAKWQKEHLWKPADGDDLPDIDREIIALLDNGKVVFAHRPPEYWDGKNIITSKVTRHYPKTYDKGGWNIPNVKYWLDVELPKEIEL